CCRLGSPHAWGIIRRIADLGHTVWSNTYVMRFSSIRNGFLRWFLRCALIGLIIGTLYGIAFASLSASPKAFLLIPLDVGFSLVLACIFWPVASRVRIYPQSRFVRIVEGTLHGAMI